MTKTHKPAPTTQGADRDFRAQVAQMTAGLAPTAFTTAWSDWVSHLALSPSKQHELQSNASARANDTWMFALRALAGAPMLPAEGLDGDADRRFAAEAWSRFPINLFARA
jgi:polyhydroxyalkanoate synthase